MSRVDASQLRELFAYDPSTGAIHWKDGGAGRNTEKPAGSPNGDGYISIRFGGKNYRAHRVVWAIHFGDVPPGMQVDHINGNRSDNRVENLRLATNKQNSINSHVPVRTLSGFRGVYRRPNENKWRAQIKDGLKSVTLGYFHTPEEAHAAFCKAAVELHGEFARGLAAPSTDAGEGNGNG